MDTSSVPQATPSTPSPDATSQPKRRWFFKRYGFWIGVAFLSATNILAWSGWKSLEAIAEELPEVATISTFSRDGTITIRAADNSILQQQGPATRQKLRQGDIPEELIQAFLAAEDRRFYDHSGIDAQGILRAAGVNLRSGEVLEGGSTVTQQLARMVFLSQEKSAIRKLREALLAIKIEDEISKEDILNHYLNLVYLGSGAYGVADAAWVYFHKRVDQLTLAEMATLAGLPPAPTAYSPIQNPDVAKRRRNRILEVMESEGMITADQARKAKSDELALKPQLPRRLEVKAPYFTSYVLQQLPNYISNDEIELGGLVVETTLLPKWQEMAVAAAEKSLKERGKWQRFEQVAIASIDPRNGEIRTMVGGLDFIDNQYNRVTQARRQPGSTFKGVIYAAAVEAGLSPYAQYLDEPYKIGNYKPKNFSGKFSGWQSVVVALSKSTNIVALKIMLDTGAEPTIEMARKMGITSPLEPTPALSLGAYEVTLLEMIAAFGTFAADGKYFKPHGIRRIRNREGEVLYEHESESTQALSETDARIMSWMLQQVVTSGTGRPANIGRPAAGKTGTSDKAKDLWFVGYVPQLVTGVWLGNDSGAQTWGGSGAAAATWRDAMVEIVKSLEVEELPKLPSLEGRKFQPKKRKGKTAGEGTREEKDGDKKESDKPSSQQRSQPEQPTPQSTGAVDITVAY